MKVPVRWAKEAQAQRPGSLDVDQGAGVPPEIAWCPLQPRWRVHRTSSDAGCRTHHPGGANACLDPCRRLYPPGSRRRRARRVGVVRASARLRAGSSPLTGRGPRARRRRERGRSHPRALRPRRRAGSSPGGDQWGEGGANTTIPRGPELARAREAEARCAAAELGAQQPLQLGFPDGKLGDHAADPSLLYRLTAWIAEELHRLGPDVVITWGPDGGTGHPDHRLVSNLVTQLARAGAARVPDRLYYMYLPVEGFRALNPERGEPPSSFPRLSTSPSRPPSLRKTSSQRAAQWRVIERSTRTRRLSESSPLWLGAGTEPSRSFRPSRRPPPATRSGDLQDG